MSCECDLCRRRELHPGVYPEKREEAEQEIVDDVYARYYSNDPELADSEGFSGVGTADAAAAKADSAFHQAIQKSIDEGLAKLHAVEAATGVRHVFVHDPDRAYGMKLVPAETRKQFGTCIRHGRTICLVCACAEGNANE